jgi:hypothetical protein
MAAVELEMPPAQHEQLRTAQASCGQQLEHEAVRGLHMPDDQLHRLDRCAVPALSARERARPVLVLIYARAMRERGACGWTVADQSLTTRTRQAGGGLRDASAASGVPVATLSRIEQGRMPNLATFRRVIR